MNYTRHELTFIDLALVSFHKLDTSLEDKFRVSLQMLGDICVRSQLTWHPCTGSNNQEAFSCRLGSNSLLDWSTWRGVRHDWRLLYQTFLFFQLNIFTFY